MVFALQDKMYTTSIKKQSLKQGETFTDIPEKMIAMFTRGLLKEK